MTRYRYQIHPAPRGSTELEDRLNFFGATGRRVVQVITTSSYWWLVIETPHESGVIHVHPERWSDRTPCCGFRLPELGTGVLTTTDPKVATCSGHGPAPCPRCGKPMHKVQVPAEPGDDSWVWGHDCEP